MPRWLAPAGRPFAPIVDKVSRRLLLWIILVQLCYLAVATDKATLQLDYVERKPLETKHNFIYSLSIILQSCHNKIALEIPIKGVG
jgi:hypothetical protein